MDQGEDTKELNYCYNCMRRLEKGQTVCPDCGHDNSLIQNPENALPEGTILSGKYLVGRKLGQGGFGITYLGFDLPLQVRVAIKEYFPVGVGIRMPNTLQVTASDPDGYRKGCDEFQAEAQTLARFNSPNIVHVRDYFHENGTAYIVMDYVEGNSLTQEVAESGGRITWERVLTLFKPLILEMDKLHKKHLIHRDIKPDNLKITTDEYGEEHLVLLDFGAARSFVSSQVTKTYTAMVTPGYAPLEQYSPKSRQGPYTDVYALCATMYAAIMGEIPVIATDRVIGEGELVPFREKGLSVPETVEKAIFHGMEVLGSDRPQSMKELYDELTGVSAVPARQKEEKKEPHLPVVPGKKVSDHPEKEPEPGAEQNITDKPKGSVSPERKKNIWIIPLLLIVLAAAGFFLFRGMRQNQLNAALTQTAVSLQELQGTQEQETLAAKDAKATGTAQQRLTEQSFAVQETGTQEALFAVETAASWNETKQAELRMTETKAAASAENTQTAQAGRMEQMVQSETQWVQQTQAVMDADRTATAWFVARDMEMRQTQTQSAENIQNTLDALIRQTEQVVQTAEALERTREAELIQVKTQAYVDMRNTQQAHEQQTAQAVQTAEVLERTREAELRQTETQAYADMRNTQQVQEQRTVQAVHTFEALERTREAQAEQTADALESTQVFFGLIQTDVVRTQEAAVFAEQTRSAWEKTVEVMATQAFQQQEAFNATQTKDAEPTATQTPVPTNTIIPESPESAYRKGDVITYGYYEQDNNKNNGPEPIEWIVLAVEDGRVLLISQYGLDVKFFHETGGSVTWEKSTLRQWLNNEFYNSVFTDLQKSRILQVVNQNRVKYVDKIEEENDTIERIFLLSSDEVFKYFENQKARICEATAYAKAKGAMIVDKYGDGSPWWLRFPVVEEVYMDGILGYLGDRVTSPGRMVRPAFWLDLKNNEDVIASKLDVTPTDSVILSTPTPTVDPAILTSMGEAAYLEGDYEQALEYLIPAAEQGYASAQTYLGYMYEMGYGVAKSYEKAVEWYQKAADQGLAIAQFDLGNMYAESLGVAQSYENAVLWYQKAADQGLAIAQYNLGHMYEFGLGVTQSHEKAAELYQKAADQRLADAQSRLGYLYENGLGVEQSYDIALYWYQKAAAQGNEEALERLAALTPTETPGPTVTNTPVPTLTKTPMLTPTPKIDAAKFASLGEAAYWDGEYEKALEYLVPAAEYGNANAQFRLALMYAEGTGVKQHDQAAVEWYLKAADQGHAAAQCSLGHMYEYGLGVTQSYEKAVEWFRKSADQGDPVGQLRLGLMYANGSGVNQNDQKAVEWFQKAADQGQVDAQSWMGYMYETGRGVTQSYEKAIEWYQKAAAQGDEYSLNKLEALSDQEVMVEDVFSEESQSIRLSVLFYLGDEAFQRGDYENARKMYQEAADLGNEEAKIMAAVAGIRTMDLAAADLADVVADTLLRTDPTSAGMVVRSLLVGKQVTLTGGKNGTWIHVRTEEGQLGWIPESAVLLRRSVPDKTQNIIFGQYEQDNVLSNGPEDIEWQVLTVEDDRALLISRYALEVKPYHDSRETVTWEMSTLRQWLNSEFCSSAFSEKEKSLIAKVTNQNPGNTGRDGGNPTFDKVFLLSIDEAEQYFSSNEERECEATAYVKAHAELYNTQNNKTWWWLRSPSKYNQNAANIKADGSVYGVIGNPVNYERIAVRPAFWLDLKAHRTPEPVKFGRYEQDNQEDNGTEAIEWQVLAVENDRVLLISRYALDVKPYQDVGADVTWENSSLRKWLNIDFFNSAFNYTEKSLIVEATNQNPGSAGKDGGNPTSDKVFLLSTDEAEQYFASDEERVCEATAYARRNGTSNNTRWWLRSHGVFDKYAAYVSPDGNVYGVGNPMGNKKIAVRPAVWLILQ